ncbi:MAG: RHS repeat protein [Lachnospiraceae bacterium]|nr:RHS repeat protein [Lachnospiraceae bacterium]MDE6251046.1 RHS repeat protein [Lachnospiraceae bacterium]
MKAAPYEYDKYGRMVRETALQDSEKSKVTIYEYDRCGRIINQKIFENQTQKEQQKPVFKRKDGNRFFESRKVQELPENREILIEETEYGYDKSGNLIKAVMPDGLVISYAYDE